MKKLLCLVLPTLTLTLAQSAYAADISDHSEQATPRKVSLTHPINFGDGELVNENAKKECKFDQQLANNVVRFARAYKLNVVQADDPSALEATETVALTVEQMRSYPGNMLTSAVTSYVAVRATRNVVGANTPTPEDKLFECKAGSKGFTRLGACQRYSRCAINIGKKVDSWLAKQSSTPSPDQEQETAATDPDETEQTDTAKSEEQGGT